MENPEFYGYTNRKGILPVSWQDFHALCRGLALVSASFDPGIVLGLARGGMYPGTLIAHLLRVEFYPARLTRRVNDRIVREHPEWLVLPPAALRGERVLVVDEISSSGETLRMAIGEARRLGASEVRSAVLYAHSWGTDTPDYIGLVSDALILNPWDREIVQEGRIVHNPEYVDALSLHGISPEEGLGGPGQPVAWPAKLT